MRHLIPPLPRIPGINRSPWPYVAGILIGIAVYVYYQFDFGLPPETPFALGLLVLIALVPILGRENPRRRRRRRPPDTGP